MSNRFYVEPLESDDPYGPLKVMDRETKKLVLAYHQDDAPVHDFNSQQRSYATTLCDYLNMLDMVTATVLVMLIQSGSHKS